MEALPKGFRFRPTDEELISHYLRLKINGRHSAVQVIPEIDVCKREPWDLPALSVIKSDDPEWFFFCPRDRKYSNGHRSNRATEAGYWKATGKDRTIKSRKSLPSGHSNIQLIGTKKTLVFYKGRAPKGERTNWIMHEYCATKPDIDGSSPGQGDYVLCRLFHKADDKLDKPNYDEVEATGSSPSVGKSSPDDVTSDLFQEAAMVMDTKEAKDRGKQLANEEDYSTSMTQVPFGRCDSNVSGNSEDKAAGEVFASLPEILKVEEPAKKVLSTSQSPNYADSEACIRSPFSYDFGCDPNGFHFQDGTSEQDASLSELLKGLQNLDNYFHLNSTTHMNLGVTSDILIPEQITGLEVAPTAFSDANHFQIHDKSDTQMAKSQYALEEDDSFVNRLMSSHCKVDDLFIDPNMMKDGSTPGIGTTTKIWSRQRQNRPCSVNIATHGTASRRIRLLMESRLATQGTASKRIRQLMESEPNSICCEKYKDASSTTEKESQPLITEPIENTDSTCQSRYRKCGHLDETKENTQASDPNLVSPAKYGDEKGSAKMSFMPSSVLTFWKGASYLNVSVVSIYIVIIISIVSLGLWKCPKLNAPYD